MIDWHSPPLLVPADPVSTDEAVVRRLEALGADLRRQMSDEVTRRRRKRRIRAELQRHA